MVRFSYKLATVAVILALQLISYGECRHQCPREGCENGGRCESAYFGLLSHCECTEGFTGRRCERKSCENADADAQCQNGGECEEKEDWLFGDKHPVCECKKPFFGPRCEFNPCDRPPMDMYESRMKGPHSHPHPHPHHSPLCLNNGTCFFDVHGHTFCRCPEGFKGPKCQVQSCSTNPCLNGAECVDSDDLNDAGLGPDGPLFGIHGGQGPMGGRPGPMGGRPGPMGSRPGPMGGMMHGMWEMMSGMWGDEQEEMAPGLFELLFWHLGDDMMEEYEHEDEYEYDDDEEEEHNSTRPTPPVMPNIGYKCICEGGYGGPNCGFRACDLNPCFNNGTCTNNDDGTFGATCECEAGYSGLRCQFRSCESETPCLNGGTCTDLPEGPSIARMLERLALNANDADTRKMKPHNKHPMNNMLEQMLEHKNGIQLYTCECPQGFDGVTCEEEEEEEENEDESG